MGDLTYLPYILMPECPLKVMWGTNTLRDRTIQTHIKRSCHNSKISFKPLVLCAHHSRYRANCLASIPYPSKEEAHSQASQSVQE